MKTTCEVCGTEKKALLTSTYCPNEDNHRDGLDLTAGFTANVRLDWFEIRANGERIGTVLDYFTDTHNPFTVTAEQVGFRAPEGRIYEPTMGCLTFETAGYQAAIDEIEEFQEFKKHDD